MSHGVIDDLRRAIFRLSYEHFSLYTVDKFSVQSLFLELLITVFLIRTLIEAFFEVPLTLFFGLNLILFGDFDPFLLIYFDKVLHLLNG